MREQDVYPVARPPARSATTAAATPRQDSPKHTIGPAAPDSSSRNRSRPRLTSVWKPPASSSRRHPPVPSSATPRTTAIATVATRKAAA
ncbi:hypothetical protein [Streptomyces sp. NPDC001594]|uniref:hypothetical protein n=1 Tax=Streptomyces sp. NPDC001594 TaxID=3364590 RepID=UPI0036A38F69